MNVRPAGPDDSTSYSAWLNGTHFDAEVFDHPTCISLVVEDTEPRLMNSFTAVMMADAVASQPGISPIKKWRALVELFKAWQKIAASTGVREVYFPCTDERLGRLAEHYGFEKVSHPMYRVKL